MNIFKKAGLLAVCALGFYNAGAQTEAIYYTNMGNFNVVLTDTLTPKTVDSFIARVSEKFYDGLIFHRVIDGFMIQGGDPAGNGTGGPGYTLPDEFSPTLKNVAGALAMANEGHPHTGGCQFYINLATNAWLDNHYTVFGKVTANYSVVQTIGHVPTNSSNDKPLTDVVMDSIRIINYYHPAAVHNTVNSITAAVYPNPCRGIFNINLPGIATKVEVLNMQGAVVYSKEAKDKLNIDLRSQPTGLYMIRVANVNGTQESKLIIQ